MAAGCFANATADSPLKDLAAAKGITFGTALRRHSNNDFSVNGMPDPAISGLSKEAYFSKFNEILAREHHWLNGNLFMPSNNFKGPGVYDWTFSDAAAAKARELGLRCFAHSLTYQWPDWWRNYSGGDLAPITFAWFDANFTRYHDIVDVWVLANEQTNSGTGCGPAPYYGCGRLYQALGRDFLAEIYTHSRARLDSLGSSAKLIINEASAEREGLRADLYFQICKEQIQTYGAPIDGIGFQFHITEDWDEADFASARRNLMRFARGLQKPIYITELDVNCYEGPSGFARQAEIYRQVIRLAGEIPGMVGIVTWGFGDQHMWRSPDGHALYFDKSLESKPAYAAIREALAGLVPGDVADIDGDGLPGLIEIALGRDPLTPEAHALPRATVAETGGQTYLKLTYTRLAAHSEIVLNVTAAGAPDGPWSQPILPQETAPETDSDYETVAHRDLVSLDPATPRFIRLQAERR